MPRYRIEDDNGNTLTLEGDSPPDEQELEEIFSSHAGVLGKSQLPDRTAEIPELLGESVRQNPFTQNRQAVMSISGLPESPHNPFREYEGQEYSGTDALAKMGVGLQAGFNELGRQGWTVLQALQEPLVKVGPLSLTPSGIRRTGATIENAQFARQAAMESGRMAEEKQSLQAEIPGPPIIGDVGAGLVSTVPAMAAGPFGVAGVVGASGIQQGAATLARAQDVYEGQQQAFDRYGRLMSDLGVFKNPDKVASTKPVNPTESNEAFDVMPNRAFWRASVPAALDAAQTAAITALSGKLFGLGAEGATVRQSTKMIQNKVGNYAKGIVGESLEEGAQQFVSDYVIAKMSYDPKITFEDAVKSAIGAAAVGGIIGGGVGALSLLPRDGERPAATVPGAEATTAAELPAGTPLDVDVEAFNKANAAPAPAEAPAAESGPLTEEQFNQQYPVKPLPVRKPKPPTMEQGQLPVENEMSVPESEFKAAAKKHGYTGEVEFVDEADIEEGSLLDKAWSVEVGGKIKVNRKAWESMTPQQRAKEIDQITSEEAFHSHTKAKDALDFVRNSTAIQRAIGKKLYLTGTSDPNMKLTELQLGKEMLRRTLQQLNSIKPTELNALVGREKWTVASLDAADRAIQSIRQAWGTKASKAQLAALDRVQDNINKAKAIIELAESKPDEDETEQEAYDWMEREGMESGAPIRHSTRDEVSKMTPEEFFDIASAWNKQAMSDEGGAGLQIRAEVAALNDPNTAKWKEASEQARKDAVKVRDEVMKNPASIGDPVVQKKFQGVAFRTQFFNEGLAMLTGEKKPNERTLRILEEQSKPATPEQAESELGLRHDGQVAGRDSWTIMEDGVQGQNFITKKGATLDEIRTKMESIKEGPQEEAAAPRRGGPSKRGQEIADQKRRILEMQAKARGEELPPELQSKTGPVAGAAPGPVAPEERVSAEAAGADRRLNALEIEQKADENLAGPVNLKERPGFGEFSKWASNNVEGVKPDQIRAMWEDAVWGNLLNATPERLVEWRQALGLESRYGRAKIAAAKPPEGFRLEAGGDKVLERQNRASAEAAQRYRNKVIAAVARKLISESITDRPSLTRQQVGIDDLDFSNAKTKFGPYVELSRDDISNLETLNHILRDQARASSVDPESASRRLVAVVDPAGKVELLSTYNDAGVQRVTDPAGARMAGKPNRELNKAFLRQYRPFASLLLADPVKGFRQKFESVSEFNDKIANEARQRATIGEFPGEGPAPADFQAEGTPGIEGEGGSFVGPKRGDFSSGRRGSLESNAPITDVEIGSIFDNIRDETGKFDSADDVGLSMVGLTERAKAGTLTAQDRVAISAYRKVFDSIEEANPDLTREEILERVARKIYENHATSKTRSDFVKKGLAEFRPRNPEFAGTPTQEQEAGSGPRGQIGPGRMAADLVPGKHAPAPKAGQEMIGEAELESRGAATFTGLTAHKTREQANRIRERIFRKKGLRVSREQAAQILQLNPGRVHDEVNKVVRRIEKRDASLGTSPPETSAALRRTREVVMPDTDSPIPRFIPNVSTALTQAMGLERIPFIGKFWGERGKIQNQVDQEIVGYSIKRSIGNSQAAITGARLAALNEQLDVPFKQDKDGKILNLNADPGQSRFPSDVFEDWQRQTIVPEKMAASRNFRASEIDEYSEKNKITIRLTPGQDKFFRQMLKLVEDGYKYLDEKNAKLETYNGESRETRAAQQRMIGLPKGIEWYSFPRVALFKRSVGPIKTEIRRRIGGQYGIEKDRLYKRESQGQPTTAYEPDMSKRMVAFVQRIYKAVADADLANSAVLGGETAQQRTPRLAREYEADLRSGRMNPEDIADLAQGPRLGIEGEVGGHPAFAGKIYPIEIANRLSKAFGENSHRWVRTASELSTLSKAFLLTGDLAQYLQQGSLLMFRHPAMWANATSKSLQAIAREHVMGNVLQKPANLKAATEFVQAGGSLGHLQDFMSGSMPGELATRVPGFRQVVIRSGRAFGTFQDIAKLEMWKALRDTTPREEWPQVIETIENTVLSGRMESGGMNHARATGERIMLMASAYYRGAINLVAGMAEGGVAGDQARKALGSYAGGAVALMVASYLAAGMKWEEIKKRLTPGQDNRKFLKYPVKIGNDTIEVGPGGIVLSLLNLGTDIATTTATDPKNMVSFGDKNPIIKWLTMRLGPAPSMAREVSLGENALGQPIGPIESGLSKFIPIPVQKGFRAAQSSNKRASILSSSASFIGIDSSRARAMAEIHDLAEKFVKDEGLQKDSGWDQVQNEEPSYTKLRGAVAAGSQRKFNQIFEEMSESRADSDIMKAMKRWRDSPFTGSKKAEAMFRSSLTDYQAEVYDAALEERYRAFDEFLEMYSNRP